MFVPIWNICVYNRQAFSFIIISGCWWWWWAMTLAQYGLISVENT